MIRVNWVDAITYVEWLKQKTGKPYRLLTEAEWEWVADCYHKNYEEASPTGKARTLPARGHRCHRRVLRGGSFNRNAQFARSAHRYSQSASIRSRETGFRVARDLD